MKRRLTHKLKCLFSISVFSLLLALPVLAQPTTPSPLAPPANDPLPGTGLNSLKPEQQQVILQLMQEGGCPCDPKITLYACIVAQSCASATALASFGVERFKEGMGAEQVVEAIINKYVEDFVPPATFELKDTARKGPENAPITIVEFADFECPHCALMSGIMKELTKVYPQNVKVYFKQFPLPMHSNAFLASKATLAAQRQGAFWPMHDLVFSNQSKLTPESFSSFAQELGLNLETFNTDLQDPKIEEQINRDKLEGIQAGLQGTPTLFFNGKMYRGDMTLEGLKKHVEKILVELKAQKQPVPVVNPEKK